MTGNDFDDGSDAGGKSTSTTPTDSTLNLKRLGPLGRLLNIDSSRLDLVFALSLLALAAAFTVISLGYSTTARRVPLLILVAMMVMLMIVIVIHISPRVGSLVKQLNQSGSLQDNLGAADDSIEVETDIPTKRISAIKILLWMGLLYGAIYVAGHIVGIFVFLLLIYWVNADQTLARTLLYTLINTLFIYGVFRVGLNAQLYDGLIGLGL